MLYLPGLFMVVRREENEHKSVSKQVIGDASDVDAIQSSTTVSFLFRVAS